MGRGSSCTWYAGWPGGSGRSDRCFISNCCHLTLKQRIKCDARDCGRQHQTHFAAIGLFMKVVFTDPITLAISTLDKTKASIQPSELYNYWSKLMQHSGRATIYGLPVCFALWIFIVFPDFGMPSGLSAFYAWLCALLFFPVCILLILLHEIVHLLALPNRIFRPDTYLVFDLKKPLLKMGVSTRIGGRITREQFIWYQKNTW